jgi:hypothetical protein
LALPIGYHQREIRNQLAFFFKLCPFFTPEGQLLDAWTVSVPSHEHKLNGVKVLEDGRIALYGRRYAIEQEPIDWDGFLYIINDGTTSLAESGTDMDWSIYPNPGEGDLNLDTRNLSGVFDIQVFDALGRIVHTARIHSGSRYSHDLSHLDKGLYFIEIGNGHARDTRKWVLE